MSKLAADVGAVNLSQGFPDFDCDPALVDAVARHMRAGLNQYAPMQGVPALRQAIAAKYAHYYGASYDPDTEVTVTSGGTEAIFDAVASVVHPGDEVIVLEPCYDSYVPSIELNGGVPVAVPLRLPDYRIDWDAVRGAITPRTRLLMINSPHNPTGSILTAGDIAAMTEIVGRTGIYIVSDEVYEHIIFDGARHESMARHPELAARSFVVGSFGKTYHVTGWKVGYVVAPAALTAELRKVHQFVTFSTHTPVQHAIAEFLTARTGLDELPSFFQRKRDLFLRLMQDPVQAAAVPRQLLPADGLFRDQRSPGCRVRDLDDEGARRGIDSDLADAASIDRAAGGALLFREEGRNARAGRRAAAQSLSRLCRFPVANGSRQPDKPLAGNWLLGRTGHQPADNSRRRIVRRHVDAAPFGTRTDDDRRSRASRFGPAQRKDARFTSPRRGDGTAIELGEQLLTAETLAELRFLPVLQHRVGCDSPVVQKGHRPVEPFGIQAVPSHDHPARVVPDAAAVLHRDDDGVGWQRRIDVQRRFGVTLLAMSRPQHVVGPDEAEGVRSGEEHEHGHGERERRMSATGDPGYGVGAKKQQHRYCRQHEAQVPPGVERQVEEVEEYRAERKCDRDQELP